MTLVDRTPLKDTKDRDWPWIVGTVVVVCALVGDRVRHGRDVRTMRDRMRP